MASMRAMERPTRHPLVEANAALADLRQGLASLLQASLLPPPIQEFVEELLLFLNIAPWWRARFFRSVARTRLASRIRRAHRRDFGHGGGAGLLASNLRAWLLSWWQYLLLGHET